MITTRAAGSRLISGPAGAVVHRVKDPALGGVEIAVLDPDADLDLLHGWVTARGTAFWGLGGLTRAELRDLYAHVDGLASHHAFLVRRSGEPIALLQTYEPENDPLGAAYPTLPGDIGVHFLLAARGAPVAGFTTRLGVVIGGFLFSPPAVGRILIEPDVRNGPALARARLLGFELGPEVRLADKVGRIGVLSRRRWEGLRAAGSDTTATDV